MIATPENHPLKAAMVMIAAMLFIGVIDNFIAPMAEHIGLWQFHFIRTLIALPMVALMSLFGMGTLWPVRMWAVALRSALLAVSMLFYFSALAFMPIQQALAGLFTSPIFILLVTVGFMGQRIGPWRILAVAVGFTGILFVLQPNPADFDVTILIPVAGGFFYALSAIATRSLCAHESTLSMLAGVLVMLGLAGACGVAVLAIFRVEAVPGADGFAARGWVWPVDKAIGWIVMQAVGSIAGVYLIIRAYQLAEPSYIGVFEYSVMIFGPLFAWIAFGNPVGGWQAFGIALIVFAGIIIALRSK